MASMLPPHYGGGHAAAVGLGDGHQPLRLSAPPLVDLPNGPGSTLACLRLGLLLVSDERGRYVVMINGPTEHEPGLEVEIAGLEVEAAQAVQARLGELRNRLNVYRGQVLDVATDPMGGVVLEFGEIPGTAREDVVLPEVVLGRVERHALGVAAHREALLAAGQHLKRGLLLYGPPGTGKTHTTRYLVGRMAGYTRLLLTGRALQAIGSVAELARDLQPAVVVLEDVDLVAEERSFGPGSSPVLFDLLDAMDGAAPDADLLFVLTTNRADLLEPALAARPGRVDVAVEIDLPDADARERLLGALRPLAAPAADRCRNARCRRADRRGDRLISQRTAATSDARVAARGPGLRRRSAPCTSRGRLTICSIAPSSSPGAFSGSATTPKRCRPVADSAHFRHNLAAAGYAPKTEPEYPAYKFAKSTSCDVPPLLRRSAHSRAEDLFSRVGSGRTRWGQSRCPGRLARACTAA